MAITTIEQARDEIHALFHAAWDATQKTVIYDDIKGEIPKTNDPAGNPDAWARITVQHATSNQATLANHLGKRRFTRNGLVTVQIFTPLGTGLLVADQLYQIALDTFQGKVTPGNIWFRNARLQEIGAEGEWFQGNVSADFEYDTAAS